MAFTLQPTNINFLQPSSHRFVVSRLPTTSFFVQSIQMPTVSLPDIKVEAGPFNALNYAGDHIDFGEIVLEFKIDEEFRNYNEILSWIKGLGFPDDFGEYKNLKYDLPGSPGTAMLGTGMLGGGNGGLRSDASLMIMSAGDVPIHEIYFRDLFPTKLTGPKFDTRNMNVNYITTDVTFSIRDFDINPVVA